MSSIDIREKSLLKEWAAANSDENSFERKGDAGAASYFLTRENEETYIMPYKFETIPQLQRMINDVSAERIDAQRQTLLSIAAFKCRETIGEDTAEEKRQTGVDRGKLPEFTYAF